MYFDVDTSHHCDRVLLHEPADSCVCRKNLERGQELEERTFVPGQELEERTFVHWCC
jgi:hypothetical protein